MGEDNPLFKMHVICSICGADEELHWNKQCNQRLHDGKLCFKCDFWQEKIRWREQNNPKCVVVDGCHYLVEPDQPIGYRGFLGFGGSEFKIQFNDGRFVVCHNLWCQGRIPERFKSILTDNAKFVKDGYKEYASKIGPIRPA